MTKLQRYYWTLDGMMKDAIPGLEVEKYAYVSALDVRALEAENERLREALMRLFKANSTASSAVTLIAALEHAKAILNRTPAAGGKEE